MFIPNLPYDPDVMGKRGSEELEWPFIQQRLSSLRKLGWLVKPGSFQISITFKQSLRQRRTDSWGVPHLEQEASEVVWWLWQIRFVGRLSWRVSQIKKLMFC